VTEYFPGSRQVVTPLVGPPDPLAGVTGRVFTIQGVETELFSITDLASALNRKPVTIRKWEAEGHIPKATFSKPGANRDVRGRRRLYSRPQVEALVRIAGEEKILHDLHKRISSTQFKVKAFDAFRQLAGK
jgi:hypothetical protein